MRNKYFTNVVPRQNNDYRSLWAPRTSRGTALGGFTLLEILIALFIFTIISMIMVSALHNVLTSQNVTEKKSMHLTQLETALILLSRDFEQTLNRPVLTGKNLSENFVGNPEDVVFTHAGLANPLGALQRSTLQHVHYYVYQQHLIRAAWPVLEQTSKTQPDIRILLDSVENIRFEYLDTKNQFHDKWPMPDDKTAILPKAVRMTIVLKNEGKLTQLYLIPAENAPNTTNNKTTTS